MITLKEQAARTKREATLKVIGAKEAIKALKRTIQHMAVRLQAGEGDGSGLEAAEGLEEAEDWVPGLGERDAEGRLLTRSGRAQKRREHPQSGGEEEEQRMGKRRAA